MKQTFMNGAARTVIALCLAAGALAACNQNGQSQSAPTPAAALPLDMTATGPTQFTPAPTVNQLPPAPAVRVGRLSDPRDTYAYAEQADQVNDAFGDAPPDYGFDYDGARPWVWRGDDQSERVVEPLPGGGDRYYYYEPGAQYPYLVRDPEYSYGYDSGVLVVVYDHNGRALPPQQYRERVDPASRILARGLALLAASAREQHRSVVAANWEARQERIAADNAAWERGQEQQSDWAAYHAAHAQEEQAQWNQERFRREAEAARFAQATNHPDVAQRDWQAAQQAHANAPAAGPAAPVAPTPGGPSGPFAGDHPPGAHGPNQPAPTGPQPAGPAQTQPVRQAAPLAAPVKPEPHAAPTKPTPLQQVFHPAAGPAPMIDHRPPVGPPPKAVDHSVVTAPAHAAPAQPPPNLFDRALAQSQAAHNAAVVHAPPPPHPPAPVVHASPPPHPAAVVPPKPPADKSKTDDKHPNE